MRFIDLAVSLIEHNEMEAGRDVDTIRSLNRHTLEQIIAASAAGILVVDAKDSNLSVVYTNPAYSALTGYAANEVTGKPWALLARDAGEDAELKRLKAALGRSEPCRVEVADLRKDGTTVASQINVTPLHNARGDLKYFLCLQCAVDASGAAQDSASHADLGGAIDEPSSLQRELGRPRPKLASLDRLDPATGLLRFGYFQDTLRRDLAIARRDQRVVTLLVFEIAEFDVYRQTFGSKAADSCQRMIGAQIMRTLRRAGDLCARYDESTLVAAVLGQPPEEVEQLADQVADNVRQLGLHNPRAKSSRYITTQVAIIGCPPGEYEDPEPAIARAVANLRDHSRPKAVGT